MLIKFRCILKRRAKLRKYAVQGYAVDKYLGFERDYADYIKIVANLYEIELVRD